MVVLLILNSILLFLASTCLGWHTPTLVIPWRALFRCRPMPVPGLSLLGPKRIRGFVSILRYINPTITIIIMLTTTTHPIYVGEFSTFKSFCISSQHCWCKEPKYIISVPYLIYLVLFGVCSSCLFLFSRVSQRRVRLVAHSRGGWRPCQ